jgi:hypothetical protein
MIENQQGKTIQTTEIRTLDNLPEEKGHTNKAKDNGRRRKVSDNVMGFTALKILFNKSFEEIGINRIVNEVVTKHACSFKNRKNRTNSFFAQLNVLISHTSARKLGDILMSIED